ncbi:MAG: apolipoprotein N-acyltransferase [Pseudomonadota bacterium]
MGGGLNAILDRRRSVQLLISALIGAIGALGQAPFGLWPATVLSLGALFALLRQARSGKQALGLSWAAGMGYFAVALMWIVEPFLVDIARHGWMAPFALLGVSVGFGLFWAVAGWATFKLRGQAIAFICAFVIVEAVRGYALTGFPWAQLGHVLIDTPLLALAPFGGSLGLTALVLFAAVPVAYLNERAWGKAIAAVLFFGFLHGAALAVRPVSGPKADSPTIRMIHTNEAQETRWDPALIPANFDRKLAFTAAVTDGPKPDLIVWPETSVPVLLERADAALAAVADEALGSPVVAGLQRFDGEDFYNSLIRLNGEGEVDVIYDKHHLVPFGEYVPFGDILAKFGIFGLADTTGGGYAAGPGPQVIDFGPLGKALPLICYEGVFPQDVGGYDERPSFLLLITNDAWFGEVSGPYQHLAQARLRSAEQGLPMIRAANTGVSAMIDAYGHITHQMSLGEAGWLDAPLPPALPKTIYARIGDLPIVTFVLILLGLAACRVRFSS